MVIVGEVGNDRCLLLSKTWLLIILIYCDKLSIGIRWFFIIESNIIDFILVLKVIFLLVSNQSHLSVHALMSRSWSRCFICKLSWTFHHFGDRSEPLRCTALESGKVRLIIASIGLLVDESNHFGTLDMSPLLPASLGFQLLWRLDFLALHGDAADESEDESYDGGHGKEDDGRDLTIVAELFELCLTELVIS